jgi:hypothetical protein
MREGDYVRYDRRKATQVLRDCKMLSGGQCLRWAGTIFAASYSRKVLGTDGEPIEFALTDYALQQWRQMTGRTTGMPDHFVAAANLPVRAHLYTQAAIYTGSAAAFSRQLDLKDHQRA